MTPLKAPIYKYLIKNYCFLDNRFFIFVKIVQKLVHLSPSLFIFHQKYTNLIQIYVSRRDTMIELMDHSLHIENRASYPTPYIH